jgi:ABC-type branched-subunit amino acid transport system ATPase component
MKLENRIKIPLLQLKNVSKNFGGLIAVNNVNLEINQGELVSIIGPNGAGKSTLLNLITGFVPLSKGEIWFKGAKISKIPAYNFNNMGICRTFQDLQLFGNMSVLENVMVGAEKKRQTNIFQVMTRLGKARIEEKNLIERALAILAQFGLDKKAFSPLSTLTSKECKLLCIARALATEPKFLLLDEPVAGLSVEEINEVAHFIMGLPGKGITVLLVEHRMQMVMNISHRVVVLNFGQIIADDTPARIQENEKVIAAYLGENLM